MAQEGLDGAVDPFGAPRDGDEDDRGDGQGVAEGSVVPGGEQTPAPLSDEPPALPEDDLEPPEGAEPLLKAVNSKVGPETQSQRTERYRQQRVEAERSLAAIITPDTLLWKLRRQELDRDKRMEAVRAAFIAGQKKK